MEVAEKKKMMMMLQLHTTNPNNSIPNDVIIEILSWLPAKYLLRLRWVCKYWFDLITANRDVHHDSNFIKMHLRQHSTIINPYYNSVLSFCFINRNGYPDHAASKLCQGYYYFKDTNHHAVSRSSEVIRIDHPSVKDEEFNIDAILGSSNGLILLKLTNKYLISSKWHLCILNPCTKEYRLLGHPLSLTEGGTYGFGYDETMDDYKVIRILYMSDVDLSQYSVVEVYTLGGKDSWRCIGPCPYRLCSLSHGVFLNGALYWMDFMHENIISLDIGKEEFQHVAKTPNHFGYPYELQVFEGSLCMVVLLSINHHQKSQFVEIWVISHRCYIWTKLLNISGPQWFPIKPIGCTKNGEMLILNNHKDLVLYEPKNTRDANWILKNRNMLEVYTESLVPLNSGTYARQETRIEADQELQKRRKLTQ